MQLAQQVLFTSGALCSTIQKCDYFRFVRVDARRRAVVRQLGWEGGQRLSKLPAHPRDSLHCPSGLIPELVDQEYTTQPSNHYGGDQFSDRSYTSALEIPYGANFTQ